MSATVNPIHLAFRATRGSTRRGGWVSAVLRSLHAIEGRRLLARMDDRMLADIGLSRSEAEREATRAPWDLEPRRRG